KTWQHHVLFQDGVNYYLTALLALASEPDNELTKIRQQITDPNSVGHVWDKFSRRGFERCGLGHSIAPYVTNPTGNLDENSDCQVCAGRLSMPSFDQAATIILANNPLAHTPEGRAIL